uniref:Uncharacterized protein n=1 Tax=Cannabis sativa TaxID=3483 RepID=A0A803P9C1_CANSA
MATHGTIPYRKPFPIRKEKGKKDTLKFYRYHNHISHDTNESQNLKREIEYLIRTPRGHHWWTPHYRETSKARERYAEKLHHEPKSEVLAIEDWSSKQQKAEESTISFTKEDVAWVSFSHNNPLVITVQIGNMIVARCMVHYKFFSNILFKSPYEKWGFNSLTWSLATMGCMDFLAKASHLPTGPQRLEGGGGIYLPPMPQISNKAWGGMCEGHQQSAHHCYNLALSKAKKEKMPAKSLENEPSKGQ